MPGSAEPQQTLAFTGAVSYVEGSRAIARRRAPWPRPPASTVLGTPAPDFRLPATRRQVLCAPGHRRPNGLAGRLHLQPLPLREGRDRPPRPRRLGAEAARDRHGGDLLQRRDRLPGGLLRQHEGVRATHAFAFPYLHDEAQAAARAYGAVCTPDFFGFNRDGELQYRGRLDAARKERRPRGCARDLFEAMRRSRGPGGVRGSDPLDGLLDQVESGLASTPLMADHPWTSHLVDRQAGSDHWRHQWHRAGCRRGPGGARRERRDRRPQRDASQDCGRASNAAAKAAATVGTFIADLSSQAAVRKLAERFRRATRSWTFSSTTPAPCTRRDS